VNKPRYTIPQPSSKQAEGKRTKKTPMATMSTFESSDEETSDGNYSDNDYHVWGDTVGKKSKKSRVAFHRATISKEAGW
jgi:hypothetical protein